MVKQMMIANPGINSTLDLIDDFKTVKIGGVWEKEARNSKDRHYYGLAMSVKINLDRMDNDKSIPLKERREAKALLCALSRLDRTKVPLSLLTGHEMKSLLTGYEMKDLATFAPEYTDTLSSAVAEGSNEMAFHNLLDVPTSDKVEQVNDMMEILQNHNPPALSLNPPPNFSLSLSFGHLKKNCHLTSLPNCFLPTSLPNFPLLFRVPTYVLLLPCPAFFLFIPLFSSLDGRRR
jgi:hypothetical protein